MTVVDTADADSKDDDSRPVVVRNVNPVLDITPLTAVLNPDGTPDTTKIPLAAEVVDPGAADTFVYQWSAVPVLNDPSLNPADFEQTGDQVEFIIDRAGLLGVAWRVTLDVQDDDMVRLGGVSTFSTILLLGTEQPDNLSISNQTFTDAQTDNILALGLGGSDVIDASGVTDSNLRVVLDGGTGQDFLSGGAGDDTYFLRGGDDFANLERTGSGTGDPLQPDVIQLTLEDGTVIDVQVPAGVPQTAVTAGNDRYVLSPNSTLTVIDPEGENELDFSLADFGAVGGGITFDLDLAISSNLTAQDVSINEPGEHFVATLGNFTGLVGSRFDDELTAASNSRLSGGAGADTFSVKDGTVNASFSGGADDDILEVSAIDIGDLNFSGDEGLDTLLVTGVIDGLVFEGGADDDFLQVVGQVVGGLTFGGGADEDVLVNVGTIDGLDFLGGADDDILENRGIISSTLTFGGDDGVDILTNVGTIDLLDFRGGADDDIFINNGPETVNLSFGPGADDEILLDQSGIVTELVFNGDDGADIFANLGQIDLLNFGGGADDDIFINVGVEATRLNFGGDEEVLLSGLGVIDELNFNGDEGVDSLFNTGNVQTLVFNGGADDDIFVNNGPSQTTLEFGPGADDDILLSGVGVIETLTFNQDPDGAGADGDDVLVNLSAVTTLTFNGGADDDILLNVGAEPATLSFGGDDDILLSGTAEVQSLNFSGDEGSDTLLNTGIVQELDFSGGADDDFLLNLGTVEVDLNFGGDDGLDILQNVGVVTGTLTFSGDGGLDVLANEGILGELVFNGGADDDIFVNNGPEALGLSFGGDDEILLSGPGSVQSLVFTGDEGADSLLNLGSIDLLDFSGGADDDTLRNSGTIELSLEFGGDEGLDTLVNVGVVEKLTFAGGADDDILVNEGTVRTDLNFGGDQNFDDNGNLVDVATLSDEGVDQLLNTGTIEGALIFTGGADDDVLQNDGLVGLDISFFGDEGIDILRNNGTAVTLEFVGGADDDALINTSPVIGIVFSGDAGVDTLLNTADATTNIVFTGGADDDILRNEGNGVALLEFVGGADDDTLVNLGDFVERLVFDGGADDDLLISDSLEIGVLVFGGDVTAGQVTLSQEDIAPLTNDGDDTLIVRGTARAGASLLYFNGDAGIDALQVDATGFDSITFEGGADDDAFQINAEEVSNVIFNGGADDDIFENNGPRLSELVFNGDTGADVFINDGSNVTMLTFNGGADDDVFVNSGDAAKTILFSGDAGADILQNSGVDVAGLTFQGGADDDLLISDGPGLLDLVFNGDSQNDTLLIREGSIGSSNLTFSGGADDDLLINDAAELTGLTFVGDEGVDGFQNNGFDVAELVFEGGADDDLFISTGSGVTGLRFVGGADDDILQVTGNSLNDLEFVGDDGVDTFLVNGQVESLTFGGGADDDVLQIIAGTITDLDFRGDEGADLLVNNALVERLEFTGGADDDVLQSNGNVTGELIFIGGADDDVLISNGPEMGRIDFRGDEGVDTLISNSAFVEELNFTGDDGSDVLRIQTGIIENLVFDGGADADALKYNGNSETGVVKFVGGSGNDLVSWNGSAASLVFDGGAGDDTGFVIGAGDLTINGDEGNDLIKVIGDPTASLTLGDRFSGGADQSSDTLDFASFTGGPLSIDLRSDTAQAQSSSFSVTVLDSGGIENVIGTPMADTIEGNARNNRISGADFAEPFEGTPVAVRGEVQWVYLDFESQTNTGGQDQGEFVYDEEARDEIRRNIESSYRGPDDANPWFDVRLVQSTDVIPDDVRVTGQFATITFNETPAFGRPGGLASEIDLGNQSFGGTAQVQVNGLLGGIITEADFVPVNQNTQDGGYGGGHGGGCGCPACCANRDPMGHGHSHGNGGDSLKDVGVSISDTEFGARKPAADRDNFIALSTKIAAHELGHLLGLRHADSFGPIGFGLHDPPGASAYKPAFTGPSGAFETFNHILGSPASVGSTRFDDLQDLFFGEREAVKLAYAFSDPAQTNIDDVGGNLDSDSAIVLPMATVAVPNTLSRGLNAQKDLYVQMMGVNGRIDLDPSTNRSADDWYRFDGAAGELINIDVMSNSIARFGSDADDFVDTILNVWYEVDGELQLVPYFNGLATNDDIFEPTDSSIIDLVLPVDGTYFIEVDTFSRSQGDDSFEQAIEVRDELLARTDLSDAEEAALERLIDTIEDQDVGHYQLFVFKYRDANPSDDIDIIKGNGGVDEIVGGPGDNFELMVDIGGDVGVIEEGTSIDRSLSLVDRAASNWLGSTVDYGDGSGVQDLEIDPQGNFSLAHEYIDNGNFTVTVTIRNDIGTVAEQSFDVTVENLDPSATFVAPDEVVEGTPFNVRFTDLADASTVDLASLRFSFATDLSALADSYEDASTSDSAELQFVDDGTQQVFARVFDKDGGFSPYSSTITVVNAEPTITAIASFGFLLVGEVVNFSAEATDLGQDDSLDFVWQFGDSANGTGPVTQHSYTEPGTYQVLLSVDDGDLGVATETLDLVVVLPDETSTEGATFTKTIPFLGDPEASWTATINYGDGSPSEVISVDPESGIVLNHRFDQDSSDQPEGVFDVSIDLTNDRGEQRSTSIAIEVSNSRPSNLGFDVQGILLTDQTLSFVGAAVDVESDDLTFAWDFGNGDTATGQTAGYVYSQAGTYNITLTVMDDDESVSITESITIESANQGPPIVSIDTPIDGVFNEASTFTLSAFDPDGEQQFTYFVDWGDGTTATFTGGSSLEVTHTYESVSPDGKFEISVTASDGDLEGDAATADFGVLGWTIMPDPVNPGDQMLVVVGSEGNDRVKVWDFWHDWFKIRIRNRTDQVRYKGLTQGDVETILVFGHGGNDRIDIGWSLLPTTIWGGDGDDRLRGGWGNDIILGGSGNDRIFGERGRDILIGGTGADRIHGDQHDDILIAGFTAFDEEFNRLADPTIFSDDQRLTLQEQRVALESIMDEWGSWKWYHTRRHNIMGNIDCDRQNDYFLKHDREDMSENTVFDDESVDTLWGNGGVDWFFAAEEDRVRDKRFWEVEADLDKWWDE